MGGTPTTWLVDSGATSHMTWNRALFTKFTTIEPPIPVVIADGTSIPCTGAGTVELHQKNSRMPACITIENVRYLPDLNANLLSVSKLEDRGICIATAPGVLNLVRNGRPLATANRDGGAYVLQMGGQNETAFVANSGVT